MLETGKVAIICPHLFNGSDQRRGHVCHCFHYRVFCSGQLGQVCGSLCWNQCWTQSWHPATCLQHCATSSWSGLGMFAQRGHRHTESKRPTALLLAFTGLSKSRCSLSSFARRDSVSLFAAATARARSSTLAMVFNSSWLGPAAAAAVPEVVVPVLVAGCALAEVDGPAEFPEKSISGNSHSSPPSLLKSLSRSSSIATWSRGLATDARGDRGRDDEANSSTAALSTESRRSSSTWSRSPPRLERWNLVVKLPSSTARMRRFAVDVQ